MLRLLMLFAFLALAGCRCRDPEPAVERAPSRAEDEVRPAFEGKPRQVAPEALRLCQALHGLPSTRRAECCHTGAQVHFGDECARVVSLALEARTIELAGVDACVRDLEQIHLGCGWIGPTAPPLPASCARVVVGKLATGKRCRSGLECQAGLRCRGAGPTTTGTCEAPGEPGSACELSVDVLASYTRIELPPHLECSGFCQRHRCETLVTDGGACTLDAQCPTGQRCAGSCVQGERGGVGEGCVPGGCADGLRCIGATCAAPHAEGEPCAQDVECLGACVRGTDGGRRCGSGC